MLATDLLNFSLSPSTPASRAAFVQEQQTRLVHALQPAPHIRFDGYRALDPVHQHSSRDAQHVEGEEENGAAVGAVFACRAGVNSIAVDRFEGRYLVSGGADATISIWDLHSTLEDVEQPVSGVEGDVQHLDKTSKLRTHVPLGTIRKSPQNHNFGITHVSWYPFDSGALLSSSYDHTLKMFSAESLELAASFDLGSVVYSHATSPIAEHVLVACASQHPGIRLVDLRSGHSTHTLVGHGGVGGVFTVAWSPKDPHLLASGGADGTVRFWDVRRSAPLLACLDVEDSVGFKNNGNGMRPHTRGRAHNGAVNGLVWTDDGRHVVTTGHDERVRVWNTWTGANTLVNFGPIVRNTHHAALYPCLSPSNLTLLGQDLLFYPNEKEILVYDLFEGRLLKRLKAPIAAAPARPPVTASKTSQRQRNLKSRVTALAWRSHGVELLSSHTDGTIRSWRPRTKLDAMVDEEEKAEEAGQDDTDGRKRKRQVLEDIYRDLTAPKITYS